MKTADSNWNCDLTTRSGLKLHVRPVRLEDETLLREFFSRVTPEDLRFRFFSKIGEFSHERLAQMVQVDHRATEHFLAFAPDGRSVIASAMLAFDPLMKFAEVAISVRGDHKHKGVAWELLRHVARYAQAHGAESLESVESRQNHDAIELEREQGFEVTSFPGDATLVLIRKKLKSRTPECSP